MISSLSRRVLRCLTVRASAKQLTASLMVALLILSPFTPLAPVVIVPAQASNVQDCLSSIGDAAKLAKTLAQDLPGIASCGAKAAGGDVVMAAIAIILAGYVVGNGGKFGDGTQVAACDALIDGTLATLILDGLKAVHDAGSVGHDAIDDLLGGEDNAQEAFGASGEVGNLLQSIPGLSAMLGEAKCGCWMVGGAIDIGKATIELAKDAGACSAVVADFVLSVGSAIGSGLYATGEYVECGLNPGACGGANYGTQTNIVYGNCSAGPVTITSFTTDYVDQVHGDRKVVTYGAGCQCPGGTHERLLDGPTIDIAHHLACVCNDASLAYDGSGSCQACDGYINGDGTCHACSTTVPGLVSFGDKDERACHVRPLCASPRAYDSATNSCATCQANFFADEKPSLNSAGDNTNPGQCTACGPGQYSAAGAASCSFLNCSLTQQVDDKNGGHTCIPCLGSIAHRLDADVCLDSQGAAIQQPQTCAWGKNLTLGDGTTSPAAYNTDDCKPVSCKGTDHIDLGGHECMKCQNIMNVPLTLLGGGSGAGGLEVIPMSGGKAMVNGSNGKTYTVEHVEKDGAKYGQVTGPDGKVQTAKGGGKGPMVQVCLDPPVTQPIPVIPKIPGLQVIRDKPDQQYQDYQPRPAYLGNLFGNIRTVPGADPGNFPDNSKLGTAIQGGAAATGTPMAMPGRPVPPPPPGGGNGHTVPAEGDKGTGYPSRTAPVEGDNSYSSHTVPAEGDNKGAPTSTGPGRTKGKENGGYTTHTVPAEGEAPTSTGPARTSKAKDDGKTSGAPVGGYTSFTLEGRDASDPTSTGPGRNSKGKDGSKTGVEGYKSFTLPAEGDGSSSKGVPQPHPTPRLNDRPQLRATPSLSNTPQLRATPQAGRTPTTTSNTTQPAERTRPTLNDSRSGPALSPGTGAPGNPFGR
jgi:hypothetical protein